VRTEHSSSLQFPRFTTLADSAPPRRPRPAPRWSSRRDQRKSPAKRRAGPAFGYAGGRLAFSLHKAIPPFFTLHKAKVPCPPRARKWPRCRRGQFLPDTQIYWSAEGAAFSFRYQNQFGAWGIVPPAFITRIRQLCACRGPFPAHIFAAGDPTAWLRMQSAANLSLPAIFEKQGDFHEMQGGATLASVKPVQ